MLKIIKLLFIAFFLLASFSKVKGQDGNPYISNFEPYEPALRQVFSIQEGHGNVMFFGSRRGVHYFDSEEWKLVSTPMIPSVLAFDSLSEKLLVGGNNDIGYVQKDTRGSFNYVSFANKEIVNGVFTRICILGNIAWFYSEDNIVEVSLKTSLIIKQNKAVTKNSYQGVIITSDKLFLNTKEKGLVEVQDSGFQSIGIRSLDKEKIIFSFSVDNNKYLLGTENGILFIFNGKTISRFSISDSTYLRESILQGGIELNNSMAFSTLLGGCIIADKKTGKTINIINYNSGLPDDEIFALGKDKNSGVWLAHQYGLSRIALQFPVRNFSNYSGLKGTLNSMIEFDNTVYVSTNEGVFFLNKKQEVAVHEVIEKKAARQSSAQPKETSKKDQPAETKEQQPPKKKPGFFARLFGGSKPEEIKKSEEQTNPELEIRKKKIYSLQAVHYFYEKIDGIAGKCRQMQNMTDRILVATNTGLYEIINHKARPILKDKYIYFIKFSKNNKKLYAGIPEGVQSFTLVNGNWKTLHLFTKPDINEKICSLDEIKDNELWMGGESFIYRINVDDSDKPTTVKRFYIHTEYTEPLNIKFINSDLYAFLSSGIYKFSGDSLQLSIASNPDLSAVPGYYFSTGPVVWARINNEWKVLADTSYYKPDQIHYLRLFDEIQDLHLDKSGKLWVVDGKNHLARILSSQDLKDNYSFILLAKAVTNNNKVAFSIENFDVDQAASSLHFELVAAFYLKANSVEYQYYIENLFSKWTDWSPLSKISFPFFPAGKYILHVRARNILGNITDEKTIKFNVRPPFYQKLWFIALCILLVIGLIYLVIKWRIRQLEEDKRVLEQKVQERTIEIQHQKEEIEKQRDVLAVRNEEIMQQKEEIEAQRDEIEAQRNELEKQNYRIALQNKEITDSIVYAKRIQTAVMPTESEILQIMPDGFIYFKPRDIVSGDFYWASQSKDKTIIVAADCTGHGVPGAFMSMLGISFLNEIVNEQEFPKANEILNELRQNVLNTLSQKVENVDMQDGMDIALVVIDKKEMVAEFAGAFNPMILIRNGELHEVPADRMPIGSHVFERESFKNNVIKIYKNDAIYLFSDGFISQFGGADDRKFNSKAFRQLLMNVNTKPMLEQRQILDSTMSNWMGNKEQMDDILVIGVRV
jgi:serine phosphatase RsbU (regulator of sigma subunit)/ligand-binding sensor domain-containing protein